MELVLNPLDEVLYIDAVIDTIKKEFNKPIIQNMFFQNIEYLRQESMVYPFKPKYTFSPQSVCVDAYGESAKDMYPIILLVNNCRSIFEFTREKVKDIIVPKYDAIVNVITSVEG